MVILDDSAVALSVPRLEGRIPGLGSSEAFSYSPMDPGLLDLSRTDDGSALHLIILRAQCDLPMLTTRHLWAMVSFSSSPVVFIGVRV